MVKNEFCEKVLRLKREKGVVILAHYYCLPEVQDVADFVGDSLALAQMATDTKAETILFAGVNFMGETAKVLSPDKTVLIPEPGAGCSLADSCKAEELKRFKERYPNHVVVSYVNTTVGVKALTDICCTSSNAVNVIKSIPEEKGIIFTPDRNLGRFLMNKTGRKDMILWDGACHVHEKFSADAIIKLKEEYPEAKVLVHPECNEAVTALADYAGSTSGIIDFCKNSGLKQFIIATEPGVFHQIRKECGDEVILLPVPSSDGCKLNECEYMKMITIEKVYDCLVNEYPRIEISEDLRSKALGSIVSMLKINR